MREGVLYAKTDDGVELPVIDVTNAAFAVAATEAELARMQELFLQEAEQRKEIPETVKEALQKSKLGKALMGAAGTFLDGMSTYLMKLGQENLWEGATLIDTMIAASFPALATRLRLQDVARLFAEGLEPRIAAKPGRMVCLVNIAGAAAADSWNALIMLRGRREDLLVGRPITISVMDMDARGPAFGARAVEALRGEGAPLGGMEIEFRHFSYEWSEAGRLRGMLEGLKAREAVCGVTSEGGLFEYGTDEEIVANLEVLHAGTAQDAVVVGSVTRVGGAVREMQGGTRIATRPRTMEAFRELAKKGAWAVDEVIERPFSYNLRLVKA
jgi:hypothetical protein